MCSCGRWGSECAVDAARRRLLDAPIRYTDTRPEAMGYRLEELVNNQSHPDSREAEGGDCER